MVDPSILAPGQRYKFTDFSDVVYEIHIVGKTHTGFWVASSEHWSLVVAILGEDGPDDFERMELING